MAGRHTYTPDELEEYFDRICLPHTRRVHDVSRLSDGEQLSFLNVLQKHHLVKVPWENLTQHYSWHRVINTKPQHLFHKIVRQPGRGGYCMEVNLFFHTVLYSLRFAVYMCGSRIYHADEALYGGWTHVVNLVTIGGTKYLLDGGYGPGGPSYPVPLHPGLIQPQVSPAELRLLHEPIAQNLDQTQKLWVYQHRFSSDGDDDDNWATCYCFPDVEFTPQDVTSMNFAPMLDRQTFFTYEVVAVRFSTARERNGPQGPGSPAQAALEGDDAPIDGAVTLYHDVLKWRRRGAKVVEIPFKTERDRVQALEMYFGISLAPEDVEAIQGTTAMIGARAAPLDE